MIGSGTRFLSGISYYTHHLAVALARVQPVSVILMRQLLPTRLYPGRQRVGARLTSLNYGSIPVLDGVDWYWIPSFFRAGLFLVRQRPQVLVLQWWTGTVFHSYLGLALIGRLLGARIVIEFHEVVESGEARIWLANTYAHALGKLLVRLAHGFVVHSEHDRPILDRHYRLGNRPTAVIQHGPFDQYELPKGLRARREAPPSACNLLFFGTIRPYKGLEDLVEAFDAIPAKDIHHYWLTIVGETWEDWTLPSDYIACSRYRDRITFVNRYVPDEEVAQYFAGADAVVLPYHRSSASGPLHVAMCQGLPVVTTKVGGLAEAVAGYEGAVLVPPHDPALLRDALVHIASFRGSRFADVHCWDRTAHDFGALFDSLLASAS